MDLISKRKFYAFISHAHADKKIVDRIESWLTDEAHLPVWYDSRYLPPGAQIALHLGNAIEQCRTMIIVLSKASVSSGWVNEEYEAALAQRTKNRGAFSIIPIRIEDCEIPKLLQTTKWIDVRNNEFNLEAASELLLSQYYADVDLDLGRTKDIYISRSWRTNPESEYDLADSVCKLAAQGGFRLIGDSEDQKGFGQGNRVESIISSCGGLLAILPDRGQGKTSSYMIKEIEFAQNLGVPYFIIAEDTVDLAESITQNTLGIERIKLADITNKSLINTKVLSGIQMLDEAWKKPARPHYIFWGINLDLEHKRRNQIIKRVIERVTAMPCVLGEDLREGQIQEVIKERIVRAFLMIADISDENLNTCIEAGIARGANVPIHLTARGLPHRPPFMFRDQQVWYYDGDTELLGKIHTILYPYRRRIINCELVGA